MTGIPSTLKDIAMTPQFLREEASRFRGMAETVEREASKLRLLKMADDYEQRAKAADERNPPAPTDPVRADSAATAPTLTEAPQDDPAQAPSPQAPSPQASATSTLTAPNLAARAPGDVIPGGQIKVRTGRRVAKDLTGAL